jgi:hypothetical protein
MEFAYRRTYRGPFKAIILDLVGSAFDYGSFAPSAVFLRLLKSLGVKISAEDARSGMGRAHGLLSETILQPQIAPTTLQIPAVPIPENVEHSLIVKYDG